jgi:soluble P-type ATPase
LDGNLLPEVKQKLNKIAEILQVFVLTSDEFGKAKEELKDVNCTLHIIEEKKMDAQKAAFVRKLGAEKVVAFGNGMNDHEMLKVARLGIIVSGTEGCAVEALVAADIQVTSPSDGLDLLVNQKRLRATLKF